MQYVDSVLRFYAELARSAFRLYAFFAPIGEMPAE